MIAMKDPAATVRPMSVLQSERVHRLQIVSGLPLIKRVSFSNLEKKITIRTGMGGRGKDCPQQCGQTMEIVGFESQELSQDSLSIQLFLFCYQHNMLSRMFFFLFVSGSSDSHSQAAFLKNRNRILSPSLVKFQRE